MDQGIPRRRPWGSSTLMFVSECDSQYAEGFQVCLPQEKQKQRPKKPLWKTHFAPINPTCGEQLEESRLGSPRRPHPKCVCNCSSYVAKERSPAQREARCLTVRGVSPAGRRASLWRTRFTFRSEEHGAAWREPVPVGRKAGSGRGPGRPCSSGFPWTGSVCRSRVVIRELPTWTRTEATCRDWPPCPGPCGPWPGPQPWL